MRVRKLGEENNRNIVERHGKWEAHACGVVPS
jgi:hypothetical protein